MRCKVKSPKGFVFLSLVLVFMGLSVIALEAARLYQSGLANMKHKHEKIKNIFAANANMEHAKAMVQQALDQHQNLPARQEFTNQQTLVIVEDETARLPFNTKNAPMRTALERLLDSKTASERLAKRTADGREGKKTMPVMSIAEMALIAPKSAKNLGRFFTPVKSKAVNINTAPPEVLQALSSWIGPSALAQLLKHRKQKPFKNFQELEGIMLKSALEEVKPLIVFQSEFVSITTVTGKGTEAFRAKAFLKINRGKKNGLQEIFRQPVTNIV